MRITLGLCALVLALPAAPTTAQPQYGAPRGSYERQCANIWMNGPFLSATCQGAQGGGESSINVLSCSGDIGVDASGALSCAGPGAAPPKDSAPGPRAAYDPGPGYGERPQRYGRDSITLFGGRNWRGASVSVDSETPNLKETGLNDRVASIQLDRASGPWIVCTDSEYRGRCVMIDQSVADTRDIGMRYSISSLRPAPRARWGPAESPDR
ncbi:beta/gamma crystallin-related protein [Phenylobacterium sp.]|jgi:hypothetical protein|uniref:beta/gamma crystallin-related protein n=1 Tax=Phenylobacterium sp. TaxID=1871053 RepID=UPI002E371404|nr:beta/gamma crystallin-related protein [Phenylobacterium sp.]HEX4712595.1 beta/gamma crystallin-related protein [Phenylobacterium sp.]